MSNSDNNCLLLAVPEITLTLQPLELAEGGGGILVETVGNGLRLLRLVYQNGVTPKHHCHVLDLMPIDPGQDLGPTWISRAVSDSVQRVKPVCAWKRGKAGRLLYEALKRD
uniref:Uncharacterized protein n=1 Tax=Mastacembelus armatus TaxID=205130 RepID=A0A3Q3L9S8_9TELE